MTSRLIGHHLIIIKQPEHFLKSGGHHEQKKRVTNDDPLETPFDANSTKSTLRKREVQICLNMKTICVCTVLYLIGSLQE